MSEFEKPGYDPMENREAGYEKLHEIPLYIQERFENQELEQYMQDLSERLSYHQAIAELMNYLDSQSGKTDFAAEGALSFIASRIDNKGVIH